MTADTRQTEHSLEGTNGQKQGEKQQEGKDDKIPAPNTGWKGPIPSVEGGDKEADWLLKPPYVWESPEFKAKYKSKCWCGAVEFEFVGDPIDAKFCHCHQCQQLHGAPFQWAVLYHKTSVRLVKGAENLQFYSTARRESVHDVPCKIACTVCRSPLADEGRAMVMAYPSSFIFHPHDEDNESARHGAIPPAFKPTAHIFYSERLMEVLDGVPKWSGHKGSSERLEEVSEDSGNKADEECDGRGPAKRRATGEKGGGGLLGSKRKHGSEDVKAKGHHYEEEQNQKGKM